MEGTNRKRRKIALFIFIAIAILAFAGGVWGQTFNEQREAIMKKYEDLVKNGKLTREEADEKKAKELQSIRQTTLMEETKLTDRPMHLYGKVIDQNGDPVESALLSYSYYFYSSSAGPNDLFQGYKKDQVKTNKDGLFEIKATGDGKIIIKLLGREGYDEKGISLVDYEYDKSGAYHKRLDPDERFKQPDPKNPEIIRIRKKGEPTIVLTSDGEYNLSWNPEQEKSYAVCFICDYNREDIEKIISAGKRIDLIASGKYDGENYQITFKVEGEKDTGVLLGDEKLYEAPNAGYKPEVEMILKQQTGTNTQTMYLYAKTGSPPIYSRLRLNVYLNPDSKSISIKYYSYTNPYGDMSFEEGKYMYSSEKYDSLKNETWKSLRQGKYPPKPDFKALEEEGKKEYLKTHKESR
jgi:hypothetical protein